MPYLCFGNLTMMMYMYLLKHNKNACGYNFLQYGNLFASSHKLSKYLVGDRRLRFVYPTNTNLNTYTLVDSVKYFKDHIIEKYKECKSKNKLLIIPLIIKAKSSDTISHFNAIIFNPYRKEVERFEPHGDKTYWNMDLKKIERHNMLLNRDLRKFLKDVAPDLNFIPSHKVCPYVSGFQYYNSIQPDKTRQIDGFDIKDAGGFCCAWSLYYADLRVKYPRLSSEEIISNTLKILGENPEVFRNFIRGQVSFLNSLYKRKGFNFSEIIYLFNNNTKDTKDTKRMNELLNEIYNNYIVKNMHLLQ